MLQPGKVHHSLLLVAFDALTSPLQKIQSRQHTFFSTFGLSLALALGAIIIILSLILEPLQSYFDQRVKKNASHRKDLEWITNETLHLQCLAFKNSGNGSWSDFHKRIPLTKPDELLKSLTFALPKNEAANETSTQNSDVKRRKHRY